MPRMIQRRDTSPGEGSFGREQGAATIRKPAVLDDRAARDQDKSAQIPDPLQRSCLIEAAQ